jgi:hypothetical protein
VCPLTTTCRKKSNKVRTVHAAPCMYSLLIQQTFLGFGHRASLGRARAHERCSPRHRVARRRDVRSPHFSADCCVTSPRLTQVLRRTLTSSLETLHESWPRRLERGPRARRRTLRSCRGRAPIGTGRCCWPCCGADFPRPSSTGCCSPTSTRAAGGPARSRVATLPHNAANLMSVPRRPGPPALAQLSLVVQVGVRSGPLTRVEGVYRSHVIR